jgi:hypothetical protein
MEIFNKDVTVLGGLTLSLTNASGNILTIDGTGIARFRTPSEVLGDIGAATAAQGASADTALQPNGDGSGLSGVATTEDLKRVLHTTSTGLSEGGFLSVNTDATKFDIAAGFGYIVDGHTDVESPTSTKVTFTQKLAVVPQFLATHNASYVSIDINGNVFQTAAPLTSTQRRNYIRLGLLVHPNRTTIFITNNKPTINVELGGQVQDILDALGFRSLSGNRVLPAASTGMEIKKEIGTAFKPGANFDTLITQPHSFILQAQSPITFRYRLQNGNEGTDRTTLDPKIYDLNGVETAIPPTATLASVQQVYIFQEGDVRIQPGQKYYNNLTEAVTGLNSSVFNTEENISNNGLYLGSIVMIYGTTNLNNIIQTVFVPSQGTTTNGSVIAPPLGYTPEDEANKQNNLASDGTGLKYPTVDAVNAGTATTAQGASADTAFSWGDHSGLYSLLGHTHTIANVTNLQASLDGKVDDGQVLTNVPSGAVFTDTVYTLPFADNSANWNTAFGWGDHSAQGYLTSETDSQSLSILGDQLTISNGNTITLPDNDTTYVSSDFTHNNLSGVNPNEHIDWTADQGLTNLHPGNYTDTDTVYTHPTSVTTNIDTIGAEVMDTIVTDATGHITSMSKRTMTLANLGYTGAADANNYVLPFTDNSTNWNTAFGWGDHAGLYASTAQGVLADNSVQLTGETSQDIDGRLGLNDGGNSVFIGTDAGLNDDLTGNFNVGVGYQSLRSNISGNANASVGYRSLFSNINGFNNSAFGLFSLLSNTSGDFNVAYGAGSLQSNTAGNKLTAIGNDSGKLTNAGAPNETSDNSVYLGNDTRALASGDTNEIVIGSTAEGNGSNTATLGNDSITDTYLKGKVSVVNELVAGSALGDIVSLFADRIGATNMYGFGVESGTLYYKSGGNHDFYRSKNRDGTPNGTLRAGSYSGDGSLLTGIASSAQGVLADTALQPFIDNTDVIFRTDGANTFTISRNGNLDGSTPSLDMINDSSTTRLRATGGLSFWNRPLNGTLSESARFTDNGNFAVGQLTATEKVEVNGNVKATSFIGSGSQLTGVATTAQGVLADNSLQLTGESTQTIEGNIITKHTGQISDALTITHNSNDVFLKLFKRANQSTPDIFFRTNGNSYINAGNVGIGTITPTEKLEINGNVKAEGATFNGVTRFKSNANQAMLLFPTLAPISTNLAFQVTDQGGVAKHSITWGGNSSQVGSVTAASFIGSGSFLTGVVKTTGQTTQIINSSIVEVLGTATTAIIRASSSAGAKISLFQSGETSFIQSNKSTDSFGRIVMSGSGGQPLEYLRVRIDGSFTEKNIYHEGNLASSPTGVLADNSIQRTGETLQNIEGSLNIGETPNDTPTANVYQTIIAPTDQSAELWIGSNDASVTTEYIGGLGFYNTDNTSPGGAYLAGIKAYAASSNGSMELRFYAGRDKFQTGTSPDMLIDISGNVGIGTTSPGGKLDIVGGALGIRVKKADLSDVLRVYTQGSGVFVNNGNFHVEDNVGIGTTSPTEKLEVNGNVKANSFIAPLITIVEETTLTVSNSEVIIDAASQAVSAILPTVASVPVGKKYTVIAYDATNTITLATSSSQQIRQVKTDTTTSTTLAAGDIYTVINTGTYWQIINKI